MMRTGYAAAGRGASQGAPPAARRSRRPAAGRRRRARRTRGLLLAELVVILGAWQLVGALNLIEEQQISSPSAVAVALWRALITQHNIYGDLWVSAKEIAIGLLLGIVVGVIVGVAMGRSRLVFQLLDPIVTFLYATPAVAFITLLIIWLGIGTTPKVALIFSGVVFVVIVNTETGIRTVDPTLIEMARSFRLSRLQVLRKVILPGAVPVMLAGFRLAVGRALIMMLVAEMYGATAGLGYFITNAGTSYDTTDVLMGVVILSSTAVVLTKLLRMVEARVSNWSS
jgi:ABC-type nitrate/sulfonate/bicarbonate transport system permease component